MGFTNQERINLTTKAIQAGVIDANSGAVWYETFFPFTFIMDAEQVWTQMSTLRSLTAANLAEAQANAAANPTLIQDLSDLTAAVRLTLVAGTNDSTWCSYETYGDTTSTQLKNWLLPQLVPRGASGGAPSNGYAIQLYDGDPDAAGVLVTTTAGTTGVGDNKTVGWVWNYANGLLLISNDFWAETGIAPAAFDPYVVGFRYVGETAGESGAPEDAEYVTLSADGDIPNARVLTEGTGINITDEGAGTTVTVSLENTAVTPGTYQNAEVTVDAQGRITAAEANILTEGTGIEITDGAGTTTFTLEDTAVTAGTYANPTIAIDDQGRITEAVEGTGSSGLRVSFIKTGRC